MHFKKARGHAGFFAPGGRITSSAADIRLIRVMPQGGQPVVSKIEKHIHLCQKQ